MSKLKVLGLDPLEDRRLQADLTFAYKLLFGYSALDVRDYFTMCNNVTTRAHPYKLLLPQFTTDCRKFFLVLVLYVSGTTFQLMWTLQV